jgi:hypothetical protein
MTWRPIETSKRVLAPPVTFTPDLIVPSAMQIVLLQYDKPIPVDPLQVILPQDVIELLSRVIPEEWSLLMVQAADKLLHKAEFRFSRFKTPGGVHGAIVVFFEESETEPELIKAFKRLTENTELLSSKKMYVNMIVFILRIPFCPLRFVSFWLVNVKLTILTQHSDGEGGF